jgi:hypothetical protein
MTNDWAMVLDMQRRRIAELEAALRPLARYEQMDDDELAEIIKGTLFHQGCDKYEAKLIRAARQALPKTEPK